MACVRVWEQRELTEHGAQFKTTVNRLLALRDWLGSLGVAQVAMEATGVYWKPVWAVLEDAFEQLLVNARHVKQVPGRKTDVTDVQWLCQLLEAGLLRASLVPPKPIRTFAQSDALSQGPLQGARGRRTNTATVSGRGFSAGADAAPVVNVLAAGRPPAAASPAEKSVPGPRGRGRLHAPDWDRAGLA